MQDKIGAAATTSVDVARKAGVSQTTVSRVFNEREKVKAKTADKVLAAAKELGYAPNAIARSLTSRKTNIIALVSVNWNHSFYSPIIHAISERFSALGKQILYFSAPFEQDMDEIFAQVLQYKVDGLILISASVSLEITDICKRINLPVVLFNRRMIHSGIYSVCSDNVGAARTVADYLIQKGHTSFGYIGSERLSDINADREKGFRERLSEYGLEDLTAQYGDFSYDSGCAAMHRLYQTNPHLTAIFCANDRMALGAIDTLRYGLGLRVPEDVAVIGFDDIAEGSWQSYGLTTVEQPIHEMIEATFDFMRKRMDNIACSQTPQLFPCRIVERKTV